MQVSSGGGEENGFCVAMVKLLLRASVRADNDRRENAVLQYMVVTRLMNTIDERLGCVFLLRSIEMQWKDAWGGALAIQSRDT